MSKQIRLRRQATQQETDQDQPPVSNHNTKDSQKTLQDLRDQVLKKVLENPDKAARILSSWIHKKGI